MQFDIDGVFPWGRRMAEYQAMFDLAPADHYPRILDCGGGPASFNAEMTRAGRNVVSCDPLYRFSAEEILRRITETFNVILDGVRASPDSFKWDGHIPAPEDLGRVRMEAMNLFLEDYEPGLLERRYRPQALPSLDFPDASFDLALVSHFLFLYSATHDEDFHVAALEELLRAAPEVRVFPLLTMENRRSEHLEPVCRRLREAGHSAVVQRVGYEFQKGACEMLVLRRPA